MTIDNTLLLSKNDIPFEQAQLLLHQPTIKEISLLTEERFFTGCEFLNFSKDKIENIEDKNNLKDASDFEILMTVMNDKQNQKVIHNKQCMLDVLSLLFPDYNIGFLPMSIIISKENERHLIDKDNFNSFKKVINQIFCLSDTVGQKQKYNPGGPQAKALVQKFKKRQRKLAELKNRGKEKQKIEILSRYISILAVGEHKDMNQLYQYSIPQLFNEFNRFRLKEDFEMYLQLKIAGAQNLEEVKNWMGDLHSQD